jgi:hypothetical protein
MFTVALLVAINSTVFLHQLRYPAEAHVHELLARYESRDDAEVPELRDGTDTVIPNDVTVGELDAFKLPFRVRFRKLRK